MRSLDLFTGIGGLTLALKEYCEPIAYVEKDEYAQKVIAYRMAQGLLPRAPLLAEVKNVQGSPGNCDIIVAGFPCQDTSVAGYQKGISGLRSGLFFEVIRLAKEIEPTFLFLENVSGIRQNGMDEVVKEVTEAGYNCRWCFISASQCGAWHKRERFFLLASNLNSQSICLKQKHVTGSQSQTLDHAEVKTRLATHPYSKRLKEIRIQREGSKQCDDVVDKIFTEDQWEAEPPVARMVHGVPHRLDRIKALGNSVVPMQARIAFEYLLTGERYDRL